MAELAYGQAKPGYRSLQPLVTDKLRRTQDHTVGARLYSRFFFLQSVPTFTTFFFSSKQVEIY